MKKSTVSFSSKAHILEKLKSDMGKHSPSPVPFNVKTTVEDGQIWTTSPKPKNMQGQQLSDVDVGIPVLIVDAGDSTKQLKNIIRVIPLSFDTDFNLPGETILFNEDSPLATEFLLEVFNESPMLAGNLSEFRGILPQSAMEKVQKVKKRFYLNSSASKNSSAPGYRQWKKRELEMADYLTFPVNESLWEGETEGPG